MNHDELDDLFCKKAEFEIPTGVFKGIFLGWLPKPAGQHPLLRPILKVGFELSPFGVDFDRKRWFFLHDRSPRVGHFTTQVGDSRWRDTRVVKLHYEVSRLPAAIRNGLYDEIKPLSQDLCLGLGGINAPKGLGEQFLFALERQKKS